MKDLQLMNQALLCTWHWRFAAAEKELRGQIISEKYGTDRGDWRTERNIVDVGHSLWPLIYGVGDHFWADVRYQINAGPRIKFWRHRWLNLSSLQESFPLIFKLCTNKEGTVNEFVCLMGNQVIWDFRLRRLLKDQEIAECSELLQVLESVKLTEQRDNLYWIPGSCG